MEYKHCPECGKYNNYYSATEDVVKVVYRKLNLVLKGTAAAMMNSKGPREINVYLPFDISSRAAAIPVSRVPPNNTR